MKIKGLVAVSGLPGLFKMVANRNNGLIVEDLANGKRRFASVRQHQFTPLESIGIYTNDGETSELKIVFQSMLDKLETVPMPTLSDTGDKLHLYFAQILPDYDRDRVHTGDIKKAVKWFAHLHELGYTMMEEDEEEEVDETEGAVESDTAEIETMEAVDVEEEAKKDE
ncbi:DUF5606 domain-containing protein [Haliscomenobacter hydrossis]|uniref:Uncharacterized protein n=1 Tax=Haliscomenobacter hydrossis (strain ATCC 27775 / DSM 1100 / LMG 10767 / O) TaxID=760192 RepID=F4L4E0_HALH1|nr:DUF5606 domain-containing protein [Haliscomenobacter hydrossis]AEE51809.1 hypothetical protein Halhy_3961 [Haliscomenobacter hydrossis DSM 1100]